MRIIIPTKQELRDSLRITFDDKDIVEVVKPIWYFIGFPMVIPTGFKSDGASNPFLSNKLREDVAAFSLLHDYGYRTQFIDVRVFWDSMALIILPETADKFTAWEYYVAIRLFGIKAWIDNGRKLEKYPEAKELLLERFGEFYKHNS